MSIYNINLLQEGLGLINRDPKIPDNMKINENDIKSASKFKSKVKALVYWMEKNGYSEKKISANIRGIYYSVIGVTFANGINSEEKYQPKMNFLATMVEDYCIDKAKEIIKKDLANTISSLDKIKSSGKELTQLQKDYYDDINKAIKQIHY